LTQLGRGDLDVAGVGERGLDERARLVVGAAVVRSDPADEIGLGLVGDHLDHVGEVLALGGELSDLGGDDLADGDPTTSIPTRSSGSPTRARWYVDDLLYETADLPAGATWVCDHPFFVIPNVAVGGDWPGPRDDTTQFPQTMKVDYVRVYAR